MIETVEMVVERLPDGSYRGRVTTLPGCEARAASRSALRQEMARAVARWGEPLELVDVETLHVGTEP